VAQFTGCAIPGALSPVAEAGEGVEAGGPVARTARVFASEVSQPIRGGSAAHRYGIGGRCIR